MCPGVLLNGAPSSPSASPNSDDQFDRYGRIRRRGYTDGSGSDNESQNAPMAEDIEGHTDPPVEVNGHAERLPDNPSRTPRTNGVVA
ncbi:hypothetical protein ANO14919_048910 [Xylariales sp. No.14919]|nr:hypothetical protein ANO14919_048910 [Xylariales sp. No.14919]